MRGASGENHRLAAVDERVDAAVERGTVWRCASNKARDRLGIGDHERVQEVLDSVFEMQERLFRLRHPGFAPEEDKALAG